jgi:hypothetical protein
MHQHPDQHLRNPKVDTVWLIDPHGDWVGVPSNQWDHIDDLLDSGWSKAPDVLTKYVRGY